MRIILAGATGFIGSGLREGLVEKGHEVVILTRQMSKENQPGVRTRYRYWNPPGTGTWEKEVDGMDAVINLAGESITKRWTPEQKKNIAASRTGTTQALVRAVQKARKRPLFFLNASAVGFYGHHLNEELTEESPAGNDFLANTCRAWEQEVLKAEGLVPRVIRLRLGIVLEKQGGALAKMLPPFRLGLGGPIGTGRQWMSWVHREDVIGLILYCLEKNETNGVYNVTAPHPVTMREFAETLGHVLHRPAVFPVPGFLLKLLMGEMSGMILNGQKVLPKRAQSAGYSFKFPKLEPALKEILQ